jgi:hypothetical protein
MPAVSKFDAIRNSLRTSVTKLDSIASNVMLFVKANPGLKRYEIAEALTAECGDVTAIESAVSALVMASRLSSRVDNSIWHPNDIAMMNKTPLRKTDEEELAEAAKIEGIMSVLKIGNECRTD